MAKRTSLFGAQAKAEPAAAAPPPAEAMAVPAKGERKYPKATTREGKRVATVYLEPEALKQLQRLTIDEDTTLQALLTEGINAVFAARGLSRIA
jgi:hypothetical protein